MKGFLLPRPLGEGELPSLEAGIRQRLQRGIAAIPLHQFGALNTAFANDADPYLVYAQAVLALGREADVFLGISTSGNAENVCAAAKTARAMGISTFALTGESGGQLAQICDCAIRVSEKETFRVQELHLPVYHAVCAQCEWDIFGGEQ